MKNAQTIDWHEDCLNNRRNNEREREVELDLIQSELNTLKRQNRFYELQIAAAKSQGMTEFDRDRFLKTKTAMLKAIMDTSPSLVNQLLSDLDGKPLLGPKQ